MTTLTQKYGALPPRWIGPLVDQTLQALEAVHRAGIVHRDIKPGNLLLEPTGRGRPHLRLTDFGIAVPSDEPRLTHVAMLIGTPGYMPPEQYHGADPDPSADVYALGMVTLEMLTGAKPPREPEPVPLETLRTGEPARDAVVDVIAAATTYDPAARPSAAALRTHPSLRMLLDLPADPADPIEIVDVFPPMPPYHPPPPGRSTTPGPPPQAPTVMPTLEQTVHHPPPAGTGQGVLAPVLLLVLGLLGLAASGWLLLG